MGGGGGYSKIIKTCNSVRTSFSVSFESLRITRQETGRCSFGIFRVVCIRGVFHDLSLYDFFFKVVCPNGQCFRKRLK